MASRDRELDSLAGESTLNGEASGQAAFMRGGFNSGKTDDRVHQGSAMPVNNI
jgi:hypothetical protein